MLEIALINTLDCTRQVKSWEMEKGMIIGSQNEIYRLI
jgi:hypothetical protein